MLPKPRRITELMLLLMALTLGVGANILVDPEQLEKDPTHIIVSGAVLAGGALLVHVVLWIRGRYADPYLLPIAVALNGLGLAMIHRIDLSTGQTAANTQVVWTAVAMVTCCVVLWFLKDHHAAAQRHLHHAAAVRGAAPAAHDSGARGGDQRRPAVDLRGGTHVPAR